MNKLLLIPITLLITSCQAKNDFIVGTWQSTCFTSTLTNNILETNIYNKNNTFSARREYILGGGVKYSGTYKVKRIEDFPTRPGFTPIKQYKVTQKITKVDGGDLPKEVTKKIIVFKPNELTSEGENYTCDLDKV